VGGQIIHDDQITSAQARAQQLAHIDREHLRIGGTINHHAGRAAVPTDGGYHRCRLPMAMRTAGVDSPAQLGPPVQACHVGLRTRFIQEHQLGRIQSQLFTPPLLAGFGYVWAVLLAGPESLFLYVSPISAKT